MESPFASWMDRLHREFPDRVTPDERSDELPFYTNLGDILYVAPYNLQVRKLRDRLRAGARVGSVDKFRGQEAPVAIISMCSSGGDFGTRGLQFLLNKNRLNVAVSRAKSLTIVCKRRRETVAIGGWWFSVWGTGSGRSALPLQISGSLYRCNRRTVCDVTAVPAYSPKSRGYICHFIILTMRLQQCLLKWAIWFGRNVPIRAHS